VFKRSAILKQRINSEAEGNVGPGDDDYVVRHSKKLLVEVRSGHELPIWLDGRTSALPPFASVERHQSRRAVPGIDRVQRSVTNA
jgi:hypothetical protein